MKTNPHARALSGLALIWLLGSAAATAAEPLPALNLDLGQTTVSGISSGAFMAVQFGTAHSATVTGVAATAGGPYFCAGQDSWAGAGVSRAIARCMQGDPSYPAVPITATDLSQMSAAVRAWGARGLIDDSANLAQQRVWIFHGYNDGIVKRPVSDALQSWYGGFVPAGQIFYKDELRAAHAQISASCAAGGNGAAVAEGASCNPCAITGGNFINQCPAASASGSAAYDAAGVALQLFYGPLQRTASGSLGGQVLAFDQRPYIQRDGGSLPAIRVSMADGGYLYLPAACAAGQPCRLHVAFHGCQQQSGNIGTAFVTGAGFNEWADANRIVVLYPQTAATTAVPLTPFNPQGCWDWWGYGDFGYQAAGHYATKDGTQIAAIWRMVQRLASGGSGTVGVSPTTVPTLQVLDASASQVALAWSPVEGATGYRLYRGTGMDGPLQPLTATPVDGPSWVDGGLAPQSSYRYQLRPVDGSGAEVSPSATVTLTTGQTAPACDPYFSLAQDTVVDRNNRPTTKVCP